MEKQLPGPQPIGWRSAAVAAFVSALRGGNQVALKFALIAFSPFWSAFGRMVIATACVALWCAFRKISLRPAPGEWRTIFTLGALFTVQIGILHVGADYTSPAYAVILINSNPIFANLIAHFVVAEDRLTARRIVGLLIAFAGICVVFLGRPEARLAPHPLLGNLLILLSAALVGVRLVYIQRIVQRMDPSKAAFWQMALSVPVFAAGGWAAPRGAREAVSWAPVSAILYQGIVIGGLSMVIWFWLLKKHSPGAVSVFAFSVPLFGLLLSAWLFDEQVTPRLIWGLLAVVLGIWLVTRSGAVRAVGTGGESG